MTAPTPEQLDQAVAAWTRAVCPQWAPPTAERPTFTPQLPKAGRWEAVQAPTGGAATAGTPDTVAVLRQQVASMQAQVARLAR